VSIVASCPVYRPLGVPRGPDQIPANFVQRCGSLILDVWLWFICVPFPVSIITWFSGQPLRPCTFYGDVESCQATTGSDLLVSRLLFWSFATVFTLLISWLVSRRSTLGQRAVAMRIVDDATGKRIGFGRALLRNLAMVISAIPLGLGFWWMFVDSRDRTWHDIIARTRAISP
jgi:uncharacterized RDD family membrane protein YckC